MTLLVCKLGAKRQSWFMSYFSPLFARSLKEHHISIVFVFTYFLDVFPP